jgi:hypothetical protein
MHLEATPFESFMAKITICAFVHLKEGGFVGHLFT